MDLGSTTFPRLGCAPNPKRRGSRDMRKVAIGREHDQAVANADLRQKCINGSDLNTSTTTCVPQPGSIDMIVSRGHDHGDICEQTDDPMPVARAAASLQQLLKHQAGRADGLAIGKRIPQVPHLGNFRRRIPPERQGPDAGIDEQAHSRVRSRL